MHVPGHQQPQLQSTSEGEKVRAVDRAVDYGNHGSLSRSLRALTATGTLPLSERMVQEKFKELLNSNNEERPKAWRDFLNDNPSLPGQASPLYQFQLGTSMVADTGGTEGAGREVDTLEWALQHLDATSSPGLSGLGYDLLRHVKASDLCWSHTSATGGGTTANRCRSAVAPTTIKSTCTL